MNEMLVLFNSISRVTVLSLSLSVSLSPLDIFLHPSSFQRRPYARTGETSRTNDRALIDTKPEPERGIPLPFAAINILMHNPLSHTPPSQNLQSL